MIEGISGPCPVFCGKCQKSGRSPYQMGRPEMFCLSCKATASVQDSQGRAACRANTSHVLRRNIRCMGRGEGGPCGASYLYDTDAFVRLTEPTSGVCDMCRLDSPVVMRERLPYDNLGHPDHWPLHFQEGLLPDEVHKGPRFVGKRLDVIKLDGATEAKRLYCRSCLLRVLSFRKVFCAKCFPSRRVAEVATVDPFCTQCRSNQVETVFDSTDLTVTHRCLEDPRHATFGSCVTCTTCGTMSADEPGNFIILSVVPDPAQCMGSLCRGTRRFSSGCPSRHPYCITCLTVISPQGESASHIECSSCKTSVPFGPQTETSRLETQLTTELEKRLEENIAVRCSCDAAKGNPPSQQALDPSSCNNGRPVVPCEYCRELYCVVCGKKGGCSHSSASYNLTDDLKLTMNEWQCTRVAQVLGIFRVFTIVERYLRGLDAAQRAILMRTQCLALPYLDRYFRLSTTDCNVVVFRFSRGWLAISDEENSDRVRKVFGRLRIEPADLRLS